MLGDSEGLEVVAVVCCCLVISLDRLSGFLSFATHSALSWLPSARLIPFRQALGPFHRLYFYRDSALRVVTSAYLYRPDMMEKIAFWVKRLEDRCHNEGLSLSNEVELFLQLDETEPDNCAYYFIDHKTRTQFWINNRDTDVLNSPATTSISSLSEYQKLCR